MKKLITCFLIVFFLCAWKSNSDDQPIMVETVTNPPYIYDVPRGLADDRTTLFIHKFGANSDIDQTEEDCTPWGNKLFLPTSGLQLAISSSDDTDTMDIKVQGLDGNYDITSETVSLTGQTVVSLTGLWVDVNRMINVSDTEAAGTIYVHRGGASSGVPAAENIVALIAAGEGQTLQAIYRMPRGYTGLMTGWYGSMRRDATQVNDVQVRLRVRDFGKTFVTKEKVDLASRGASYFNDNVRIGNIIPAKADIKVTAGSRLNDTWFASGFDIILYKD